MPGLIISCVYLKGEKRQTNRHYEAVAPTQRLDRSSLERRRSGVFQRHHRNQTGKLKSLVSYYGKITSTMMCERHRLWLFPAIISSCSTSWRLDKIKWRISAVREGFEEILAENIIKYAEAVRRQMHIITEKGSHIERGMRVFYRYHRHYRRKALIKICPKALGCRDAQSSKRMSAAKNQNCGMPEICWPEPRASYNEIVISVAACVAK